MDPRNDEPRLSVNTRRRTTQLNLWMIVAIVFFFLVGGILLFRMVGHHPTSTPEMKNGFFQGRRSAVWTWAAC